MRRNLAAHNSISDDGCGVPRMLKPSRRCNDDHAELISRIPALTKCSAAARCAAMRAGRGTVAPARHDGRTVHRGGVKHRARRGRDLEERRPSISTRRRRSGRSGGNGSPGLIEVVYVRPLDLSMDETLYAIRGGGSGLAPDVSCSTPSPARSRARPCLQGGFPRIAVSLTGRAHRGGVTILLTVEAPKPTTRCGLRRIRSRSSPRHHPAAILRNRRELRTFVTVVKTRAPPTAATCANTMSLHGHRRRKRLSEFTASSPRCPASILPARSERGQRGECHPSRAEGSARRASAGQCGRSGPHRQIDRAGRADPSPGLAS